MGLDANVIHNLRFCFLMPAGHIPLKMCYEAVGGTTRCYCNKWCKSYSINLQFGIRPIKLKAVIGTE